jgi:hypothetical protein
VSEGERAANYHAVMRTGEAYKEEDTCMAYEEEDTCYHAVMRTGEGTRTCHSDTRLLS